MKFIKLYLLGFILCALENVDSRGLKEEFTWTRISYSRPRGKRAVKGAFSQSAPITFPGNTNSDEINRPERPNQSSDNVLQNKPSQINQFDEINDDYIYREYISVICNI